MTINGYEDDESALVPEVLEVRYQEPVELLTKEQIKKLADLGYDMKKIYYSTYEEIREIRYKLEQMEMKQKFDLVMAQRLQEIQRANLDVNTDMRNMMADEIIRTNQWRNDEIVRRYQTPTIPFWYYIIAYVFILQVILTVLFCTVKAADPHEIYGFETKFMKTIRIISPHVNFIYPPRDHLFWMR